MTSCIAESGGEREGGREGGGERDRQIDREGGRGREIGIDGHHSLKTRRSFFVRNRRQQVIKVTKVKPMPTTRDIANPAIAISLFIESDIVVVGNVVISHTNLHKVMRY